MTSPEDYPKPEVHTVVQNTIKNIQTKITTQYSLNRNVLSAASSRLWDGTDEELKQLVGLSELNPHGETYGIRINNEDLGSIIYLSQKVKKNLAAANPQTKINPEIVPDMLTAIEETSHYIYREFYSQQFNGQLPNSANSELIAVLDKYFVLESLLQHSINQPINAEDQVLIMIENAPAHHNPHAWNGHRPPEYIIGHELGSQYVEFLTTLRSNGMDINQELQAFYRLDNKSQIEHLLYNVGLSINTYSSQENTGVGNMLNQLGVMASNESV